MFWPNNIVSFSDVSTNPADDFENEPPLLEELGVNFDHIRQKTFAVLNPVGYTSPDVIADQDLAGPLVFCLLFGASLLLNGRVSKVSLINSLLKTVLITIICFRFTLATFMELECWVVWVCTVF